MAEPGVNVSANLSSSDPGGVATGAVDAGAGLIGGAVEMLAQPEAVLFAAVLILLPFVAVLLYKYMSGEEEFSKKPLDEIVLEEMGPVLKRHGSKNLSVLRRDRRTEGQVWRDVRFNEKAELAGEGADYPGMDGGEIEDKHIDRALDAGAITEEEAEMMRDGVVPHRLLSIRPASTLGRLAWFFTDFIGGLDKLTWYMLVPEHKLRDNGADESLQVDRGLQFRPFAGIEVPLKYESFGTLHSVVMRRLYETALEDQANYHDQVNFFSAQFSQQVQMFREEMDAKERVYADALLKDVNE